MFVVSLLFTTSVISLLLRRLRKRLRINWLPSNSEFSPWISSKVIMASVFSLAPLFSKLHRAVRKMEGRDLKWKSTRLTNNRGMQLTQESMGEAWTSGNRCPKFSNRSWSSPSSITRRNRIACALSLSLSLSLSLFLSRVPRARRAVFFKTGSHGSLERHLSRE